MKIPHSAAILAATLSTSVAALCFAPSAFASIGNGSFEIPPVPAGTYANHNVGTIFGKWQVVGPPGTQVSVLSNPYVQGTYTFVTPWGTQMLDLTGPGSNQAEGVQQRIRTAPGTWERVYFSIGNVSGSSFGTSSTVKVYINNGTTPICTRTNPIAGTTLTWMSFLCIFPATTWTTTIKFVNGDPPGDNANILDNVLVVP